jgi:REP element-mobilizing transposase RayT
MARREEHKVDTVYEVEAYVVAREMVYREVWNALEYLQLLADGSRIHNCRLHAWCLLPQKIHLLVSRREIGSISGMMGYIQIRHTRRMNSLLDRRGPLWDGPYLSREVTPEEYPEILRELQCAPSMAGLCPTPDLFEWSDLNPLHAYLRHPLPVVYRDLPRIDQVSAALGDIDPGSFLRN